MFSIGLKGFAKGALRQSFLAQTRPNTKSIDLDMFWLGVSEGCVETDIPGPDTLGIGAQGFRKER